MRRSAPTLVSVCIPSLNTRATIGEQLDALAAQTYDGAWEVVVLDNGSTDGSDVYVMEWASRLPGLRVERVAERGISNVRNAARRVARGDLLAFCDGDDVVVPGWLAALVAAAESYDVVGGVLDDTALNPPNVVRWRGAIPRDALMVPLGYLPFAPGGNCAVWGDVIDALGGWDASYVAGSDDVDFAWRAQLCSYTVGFAPDAVIAYRYRADARGLYRQSFRYGRTEALLQRSFPAAPRHGVRDLLRVWRGLLRKAPGLRRNDDDRVLLLREYAYHAGRLVGSAEQRTLLP
ncbi:MAG TPA: glycosyltransferase [Frankiaceae bacterium]|nr:glycosyltransferase [Frankiaceae bacterium]